MLLRILNSPERIAIAVWVGLSLLLYPIFVDMLRLVLFDTVPRDDYAPYLMYFLGQSGGAVLPSPWGYRVLSVLAGVPFTLLPRVDFTNLPATAAPAWVGAAQALVVLSYLCLTGIVCLAGLIARQRLRCGLLGMVSAGAAAFVLSHYAAPYALDMPAILLICLGVYVFRNPTAFAAVIVPAAFANEKVVIVFGLLLAARLVSMPRQWRDLAPQVAAVAGAVILYAAMLVLVALPGNEHQTDIAAFPATFLGNIWTSFGMRGLLLNILPVTVLGLLVAMARRASGLSIGSHACRSDWLVFPGLLLLAMVMSLSWNLGRIVMHAFPLFIGPAALVLERWLTRRFQGGQTTAPENEARKTSVLTVQD